MSSFKQCLLLSLLFLANPAWSAGQQVFQHAAINWLSETDFTGYSINMPHVSLLQLQEEISRQRIFQQHDQQKYQQAMEDSQLTPGKLFVAAVMPGGFAYLFYQKLENTKKTARLQSIKLFLAELAEDQLALLPAHDQPPLMVASNPMVIAFDPQNIVNVIEK